MTADRRRQHFPLARFAEDDLPQYARTRASADGGCPTRAIEAAEATARVNEDRCVLCMRCKGDDGQDWRQDVIWAHPPDLNARDALAGRFARSLHVRIVDARRLRFVLERTRADERAIV